MEPILLPDLNTCPFAKSGTLGQVVDIPNQNIDLHEKVQSADFIEYKVSFYYNLNDILVYKK